MAARGFRLVRVVLLLTGAALAQQPGQPAAGPQPATMPTNPPAGSAQAVAKTGLLPIYGVELGMDKTWADGDRFPTQSASYPNSGVNASFQQVWNALKPAGFNFLRVGLDVYDLPASANRAANVCNWAKANNVKLLLVLRGASSSGTADYAASAAAFVKALAGLLRQDAYKASYAQVAAYELEPDLNNPSLLKQVSAQAKSQDLLLQAAQQVRATETDTLKGSGIDATPLIVRASFDYELISTKAIAGTTLANDAYNAAYSSLVQWLKPLAASPNIDLISVDWFPGAISAGGVDKPPALLRSLATDIAGKQMLFTTGFSTAFHTPDEQKQYYTMTFANLGDLRASGGASSPFLGVIYREALNAKSPAPPSPQTQPGMSKWNWQAKAGELAAMWTGGANSADMTWWVETVKDNMGLLDAQAGTLTSAAIKPKPAMQALTQISSAVSTASASAPGANPVAPGAGGAGSGSSLQGKAEQGLSGLLDKVMSQLGNMMQSGMGGGGSGFGSGGMGGGMGMSGAPCSAMPTAPAPTDPNAAAAAAASNPATMPSAAAPCTPGVGSSSFAGVPAAAPAGAPSAGSSAAPTGANPAGPVALPPGSITLGKQDVSLQPASPKVGQPVQIVAQLHNQNSSDALGVTILASGAKNAVLAQADSLHLPANSVYPANLQWTPQTAAATSITIKVSDGTGAEIASVSLDPVTVAAAAAPVATAKAPVSSASGSTTSAAGSGAGAAGGASTSSSASDNTASGSGAATALTPLGFAKIGDLVLPQNPVAGAPESIVVPISNPLLVPLNNIKASLMVDGKSVQTQSVSTLIPQQSRSIVFSNVVIAQPGSHEIKIGVQLQRGDAKPQIGAVSQSIVVQAPTRQLTSVTASGKASTTGTAHLRTLVATPPTAGASAAASSAPAGGSAAASMAQLGNLSVQASDLSYSPMPARPGQTVAFRVVVRNTGDAAVQGAALVLSLYADGKLVAASQPPIQFSVAAKGSYQANWQASMPAGQQVQLVASATTGGNESSPSGQASIVLKSAAAPVTRKPTHP